MSFQLPCSCNPNESFVKMPVSTWFYIPASKVAKTKMLSGKDPAKGVFSITVTWDSLVSIYCLPSTYLGTNMPTAQQKKKSIGPTLPR